MTNAPILELHDATKRIGGKTIIDRLNLQVHSGEVFGFLGPNGAGKTTTIRMIVGLMSITAGEIRIAGHDVSREFEKAIRHVGAIVENPEMYKYLTGFGNLVHFARMSSGVSRERIDEVIQLVGLKNRIHDKVKTYSLGMRQRLGVAQALLHKPSLLVLDEPTNGLDPAGIREMRDYLRKLARQENAAVLVSSHLLAEMELMCDRVAIIQRGKLVDIRKIKPDADPGEMMTVCFEVREREEAIRALSASFPEIEQTFTEAGIEATVPKRLLPELNRLLARAEIGLYLVRPVKRSLEEQFLEVTGGGELV